MVEIEGYHGTSSENSKIIIDNNSFKPSIGDEEWLGDGVYFFVEGIPEKLDVEAKKWAISRAWDNDRKKYNYTSYSVIRSELKVEDEFYLDLTTVEGLKIFRYIRNGIIQKMTESKKYIHDPSGPYYKDGHFINEGRKHMGIKMDVIKNHCYIKFEKEKIFKINQRTANTTIAAVNNLDCITDSTIFKEGVIK